MILFSILGQCLGTGKNPTDIVYTSSGPVRGFEEIRMGKKQFVFLGIPYAQPPINKLRFKPPEPIKPWLEVKEALDNGPNTLTKSPSLERVQEASVSVPR